MNKIKSYFWGYVRRFIYQRPNILYPLALKGMLDNDSLSLSTVAIKIKKTLSVGMKGEIIKMPADNSTLSSLFSNGDWHADTINLLKSNLNKEKTYQVFDIGANVGLVSRQFLYSGIKIESLHCVEPDNINHAFLRDNLSVFDNVEIKFYQFALSEMEGEQNFYKDKNNIGNYSLNSSAVKQDAVNVSKVKTESTSKFFSKKVTSDNLIIKFDTQGNDEKLVTLIPKKVLSKVDCMIIEVWGIEGKSYNEESFRNIISSYKNIYFNSKKTTNIDEIINFSKSKNRTFKDLILFN